MTQQADDFAYGSYDQNPYIDRGPWGICEINGVELPGVILSINGHEKPEEWNIQKPSDKSGASSVWKGTQIAEGIKIKMSLTGREQFEHYRALCRMLRPKLGEKPPTYVIANPSINFAEIYKVSTKLPGTPEWVAKEGYWTGEITLVEVYEPKPAKTGKAGGAGDGAGGNLGIEGAIGGEEVDPNKDLNDRIDRLVSELNNLDKEDA